MTIMANLTHRTNVLLTEEDHILLTQLAEQQGTTKGEVLRQSFRQTATKTKNQKTQKTKNTPLEKMRSIAQKAGFRATTQEILEWKHEGHQV